MNDDKTPKTFSASAARTDRLMLVALALSFALAVALGSWYGNSRPAWLIGILLLGIGVLAVFKWPGQTPARLGIAFSLMSMTALHVQLGRGTLEYHFGVFVVLAFLLSYRDWRPLVVAAAVIAVHHLVFDRLQAAGFGVYCLTEADLPRVLVHAGYVVAQTGFEVFMAVLLAREARQGEELASLVAQVRREAQIDLDVAGVPTATEAAADLKQTLSRVHDSVETVREGVDSVTSASNEFAAASMDLSQRTDEAASQLAQTRSSVQQLAETVRQTAQYSRNATALAGRAAEVARQGGVAVDAVVQTMQAIEVGSRRIAEITGVIDGIAFQSNILALNAAVEAARAGAHGRGFAVVASEVRLLAQRSAQSAREIKSLITASVDQVEAGVRQVGEAGTTMAEIVGSAQNVTELINGITTATEAQHQGISQVSNAVDQLDSVTQQNAALVEQSAAGAESLRTLASQLAQALQCIRPAPGKGAPELVTQA